MVNNKLHIFICHYTKLKDRKKHILEELNKLNNITYEFIENYDKEDINEELNNLYFNHNNIEFEWKERCFFYFNVNFRILKLSEKSLALKHYEAIKRICDKKLEYALIIEDDCKFDDNFIDRINKIIDELSQLKWDIYFPNSYEKMFEQNYIKNKNTIDDKIIKKEHPSTAYTCSYLINNKCCKNIINEIENNKIVLPIDFEYNWIFYKLNLDVYFNKNNPLIVSNLFKSSIQT